MTGLTPEATAPNPAGRTRVGFVGLGTMGSAMAANLARAGFPLTVFNRTPGRAGALVELGAAEAASPGQVAAASDVVVTCVPDSPQVAEVLFGPEGLVHGFAAGSLFIDCSTISPPAPASSAPGWPTPAWAWSTLPSRAGRKGPRPAR